MAQAAGYSVLPISVSLLGINDQLRKELSGPTQKAAKQAGDSIRKGLTDGVDQASKNAEKANWRVKKSADELTVAESKLTEQKLKTEAANKAVESAARVRAEAEAKGVAAVEKAEEALLKKRAQAEKAARDLTSAESGVEKAMSESARAAESLEKRQGELDEATKDTEKTSRGFIASLQDMGDELEDTAEKSGGFGSKLMSGFGKIGTGALLGVGAKIGSTVTEGIGTAFSKGFGRLQSVEQAQTMLGGLGNSAAEVESIMDSAMESVSGTAYGFGEAASMAATFSGAGIKDGKELTNVLTLVGDTAAIAGADFNEMGSIWTKVATGQKLQTSEMNQLMDRGLGVLPELQKHYGVTADEARKMVTDGKVSFEDFSEVMENMVGGSAQAMGETFSGSAANMQAALGRLGAKFLDPIYENAPAIFSAIGGAVDTLGEHLSPLIEGFSEKLTPVMEDFAERLGPWLEESIDKIATTVSDLVAKGQKLVDWGKDNRDWIEPLAVSVGVLTVAYKGLQIQQNIMAAGGVLRWLGQMNVVQKVATGITKAQTAAQTALNVVMRANPIGLVVVAVAALAAGLTYFFTKTETGQEIWGNFTAFLSETWENVSEVFGNVVESISEWWSGLTGDLSEGWESLKSGVFDAWNSTVEGVKSGWESATGAISDAWQSVSDVFTGTWETIKTVVFDAFNWYIDRVKANWELVTGALSTAWTWVKDTFVSVWESIKTAVFDAFNWYIDRVQANWEMVTGALSDSWTWVKDTFISIWESIKTLVFDSWNSITLGVKTTFEGVTTALSDSWTWVKDQFSSVWDWIRDNVFAKFSSTIDLMRSGAETAMDGIGKAFDWLREKTAKPVNFVIREVYMGGIRPAWGAVASLVGLDDLPRVDEIGGFAQGGVLPGWSPGVDDHLFYSPTGGRIALSGGEAIMRPEWTRAVGGPAAVERMNKDAQAGNLPVERHGSESAAFAHGGVFDLGAFNAGGVIGAMINIVSQKYPGLTMTSAQEGRSGGMHGAGLATDWSNGSGNTPMQLALAHDIAQTYPGSAELIYDSPGWSGNIKNGANVGPFGQFYTMAQAGPHHHHVHWGMTTPPTMPFGGGVFEGGSDGGGGGIWQSITGMVKGLWDNIIDKIPGYGGADNEGLMGKMPGAWLSTVAGSAWDFIKSKADQIMQMAGGGSAGSVDIDGIAGPVVDQVEQVFAKHGFTGAEWDAAKWIVQKESNWNPTAVNPSSGAFGLFQFNPMGGDTLGTYLPSRSTDPAVQGDAGARYIKDRYGTPTAAKAFWENNQWYDEGGYLQPGTTVVQNDTGKPEPVFNPAQWATLKRMVGNMPFIGESMQVVAKELRTAFDGGDWGYGELAHVLRNEVWAKAIVDGAATLGVISRDTDFMAANAELQQTAADAGRGFLEAQATSLLDVVGLGGLVSMGSSLWDEHGDQAVSTAHSLFGATQNPDTVATASFMGQQVTLEFNAESLDDVVRIGDLKAQADRIDGLEVHLNTKRRPPAGMVTRGGAM